MWATPTAQDYKRRGPNSNQQGLPEQVRMYNTPTAQDAKKQYTAAQPNKTRFTGWRYSERKNESREWATESIMDRMANGLPDWMDGDLDFIINHYWDDEPDIPRIATGVEHRVDRLKCLGNAVVPQQFYPIFKAIANLN